MNKRILKLAVPNIISNLTIPLLGLVDLAITGHMGSDKYIGAIALGTMIFNLIYWGFGFLRMGVSGLTAQAFGSKNTREQTATLARGLIVAGLAALVLIILQFPIQKLAFWLIDGSAEVEFLAKQYYYIRIWAAPATIGMYALTGWFIGMQNTRIPMVIAITVNIFNIGLNLLFVKVFGMKSEGVALGTLIAQYVGLAMAFFFLKTKYAHTLKERIKTAIWDAKELKKFFVVNRDIFIRTLSLLAVLTFFTSHSASTSNTVLAANTLLLQFLFIFSFFSDGFAYAAEALSGRYFGANDQTNLRTVIKLIFKWGLFIAIGFTAIYYFWGESLLSLLTNEQNTINTGKEFLFWVILLPLTSIASFLWDGIFIGITASKQMRNSMLLSTFLVFFPAWFIFKDQYHNHALWFAFILFMFSRGLTQTIMFKNIKHKLGL